MLKTALFVFSFITPATMAYAANGPCSTPMDAIITASPIGATLIIVVAMFLRYMAARDKQFIDAVTAGNDRISEALQKLTEAINRSLEK